jgi:hypothetical protein
MTDDHTHRGDDVHSVEAVEREANGGLQPIETAPKDGTKITVDLDGVEQDGFVYIDIEDPFRAPWVWGDISGAYPFDEVNGWMPHPQHQRRANRCLEY